MARKVTIYSLQFSDLPLGEVAEKMSAAGYDGLELGTLNHLDVDKAAKSKAYCEDILELLAEYDLKTWAIGMHCQGQLVCDRYDERHAGLAPKALRKDPKAMRAWAVKEMKNAAKAAENLGCEVVTGFFGSPVWTYLYSFPPCTPGMIAEGYKAFAKAVKPILDVYADCGVKFALEAHPTEIAFDIFSAERTLEAVAGHPAFGFNYDPSHLGYQGVDYVKFIRTFAERIFHVHVKDAWWGHGDGTIGVFGGHSEFGDPRRYWDFRSPGHGDIKFEDIIVALNDIGYRGPLSVEWEDGRMDRFHGARESLEFVRKIDFAPSELAFDGAFSK